ncbi:MAG: HAMP domain-containing histidine kinase [Verrucomicrobiaceae bacterium]|nr:HAMP domain-containing histidine kinase [Verrucomicrobiaceae bacterium]
MPQRPSLLLILLVMMPLSLLAWLGTYLARDAARRSGEMRLLVTDPRFTSVDPQLMHEVTQRTDEFARTALLPVFLAVASGSVLLVALGWLFHRESTRAIREAQERVTFVNQVSHELKTPLTNIQLYAEMAADRAESAGDQTALRYLGVVGTETSRLSRLINNVLNLARKQRDKLSIQPKPGVLDEVVQAVVEHWRALLESRGIAIDLAPGAAEPVRFDADAITQILGNLLSNVEKYAAQGKHVRIVTTMDADRVQMRVEDRGPGIAAGKREIVFEAFERLRSDLTEGVSGTGIGLTISRELARLHGGTLEVDPAYRDGSRFVLTIPRNQP